MNPLKKFLLFIGSIFGLYESLLWAYVFYKEFTSPTLSVIVRATSRVDWTGDIVMLALAILFTAQATIISLVELYRGDEYE